MLTKKELKKCEHPASKIIFYLAALPIILSFSAFLVWWAISPNTLKNIVATNVVTEESVYGLLSDGPNDNADVDSNNNTDSKNIEVSNTTNSSGANLSAEEKEFLDNVRNNILVPLVASPLTPIAIMVLFILFIIVTVGKLYGDSLGNGVKLSYKQFPEVYEIVNQMVKEIGLKKTPDIILQNGNGTLNAFACTVPMIRDAIVIYSDIFERCIANNDMKTLKFILGHELGHIKFNHTKWWYRFLTFPMEIIPGVNFIFGRGLSRSREYSCDKLGSKLSNDHLGRSLVILSSGKHNYQDVNIEEFIENQDKKNIWVTISNLFGDHPINSWRILAIFKKHHGGIWFKKK